jgi:preprotein translocase subunit Sec63
MTSRTEFDPYSVLGVARTASDSEIRAAYHALVAKYHPDRYQGNPLEDLANEKLVAINWAYEILSDPARRAAYDSGPGFASNTGPVYATAPGSLTRKQIRWLRIVALLLMVPLAIRFGSILVRLVVQILRGALEITKLMRGTPLAGALVLLALALLVLLLVRHRRSKRKL